MIELFTLYSPFFLNGAIIQLRCNANDFSLGGTHIYISQVYTIDGNDIIGRLMVFIGEIYIPPSPSRSLFALRLTPNIASFEESDISIAKYERLRKLRFCFDE